MNNILRNVLMRRSTFHFDNRQIRHEDLRVILEEGKVLSNAAKNQEWHFTVLRNREIMKHLSDLHERLRSGSKADPFGNPAMIGRLLSEAPMILIISGRQEASYAAEAANMVFGSMMLVGEKYGIGSCWLNSVTQLFEDEDGQTVLAELHIPDGFMPLCAGAFGYKWAPIPPNLLSSEDNLVNYVE